MRSGSAGTTFPPRGGSDPDASTRLPAPAERSNASRAFGVLLPWAIFSVLLAASWNRWMEPFVDTGRELMVPRRIAQGEVLYRDIHFHHGPLAPYAGALLERIAGRSFAARTAFALVLALIALESLRRIAGRAIPGLGGAVAAGLCVAVPFFLRPGGWLCPFSVDVAIAAAALLATLALLSSPKRPSGRRDAAAALCLLAALLSRPELGLAGIVAVALDARQTPRRLFLLGAAPFSIAAGVYGAISARIPFSRLVADGWLAMLRPPRAFQNVYRAFAGLDRPLLRLGELVLAAILLLLAGCVLVLAAAIAERARRSSPGSARSVEIAGLMVLASAALLFHFPPESWRGALALFPPIVRPVPLLCVLSAGARLVALALRRPSADWAPGLTDGALLLAGLFSLRVFLAAGYVGPYNAYFLPLPLLAAAAVLCRAADRWGPAIGGSFPVLARGALAIFLAAATIATAAAYRGPDWEPLVTPAGAVVLPVVEARTARLALDDLARRLPENATLTGFPEAGFFEYALGAKNPLPLEQFWPGHLDEAGEDRVSRLLAARPPDAVLMINALAVGEGFRAFGQDYSRHLAAFVITRFAPAAVYGPNARAGAAIGDPDFFVEIRVPATREGRR